MQDKDDPLTDNFDQWEKHLGSHLQAWGGGIDYGLSEYQWYSLGLLVMITAKYAPKPYSNHQGPYIRVQFVCSALPVFEGACLQLGCIGVRGL